MQLELEKTRIEFGISFVIVVTLMLIFFNEKIVLFSVFSSLLHECGHLFAIRICGERIERVVFGAFGLRIERQAFSNTPYKNEVIIALGGIAVNCVLFIASVLTFGLTKTETVLIFGIINLFIALFNSLPLKSLDMGRAVYFLLLIRFPDEKAEQISWTISLIFALCMLVFTVFYCVLIKLNFSLIAVCIYLLTEMELKIYGQ